MRQDCLSPSSKCLMLSAILECNEFWDRQDRRLPLMNCWIHSLNIFYCWHARSIIADVHAELSSSQLQRYIGSKYLRGILIMETRSCSLTQKHTESISQVIPQAMLKVLQHSIRTRSYFKHWLLSSCKHISILLLLFSGTLHTCIKRNERDCS